ncbi:MAG TPA: DUF2203 family protein [Myxococcota bacterium]|nr:DUF2203 family protein [Myxococcota bacterium]
MAEREPRAWSLATAREIAVEVRRITAGAVEAVDALEARRDQIAAEDAAARAALDQELAREVADWVRAMEALGVEVKGRWLVDFDNGRGYYCWRWPEERLEYFHGYDEGFAGRVRIQ